MQVLIRSITLLKFNQHEYKATFNVESINTVNVGETNSSKVINDNKKRYNTEISK